MKKIMVFTSSPNLEGLTAACGNMAKSGAEAAGAEVIMVNLNRLKIGHCKACGQGWGPCRSQHECQVKDDFQDIHASMADTDGFVIVTPVYWGDMSESAKAFSDRLRRCEALKETSFLEGKPVIAVAAAGGSGNGVISTLTNIERLLMQVRADKFDLIGITQKSRGYKLDTIHEAARAMVAFLIANG